ncbi:HIRAN domain-containing protein [Desulfobaculum sp.]
MGKTILISVQGTWAYSALTEYSCGRLYKNKAVALIRDPTNIHDPNAVKVILKSSDAMLGYIPRTQAALLAKHLQPGQYVYGRIAKFSLHKRRNNQQLAITVKINDEWNLQPTPYQKHSEVIKNEKDSSGVYIIRNMSNSRVYVGSSYNIGERWKQHISRLSTNTHENPALQYDWNQFGPNAFIFEVVDYQADEEKRYTLEELYIEEYEAIRHGYNRSPYGKANNILVYQYKNKHETHPAKNFIFSPSYPRHRPSLLSWLRALFNKLFL